MRAGLLLSALVCLLGAGARAAPQRRSAESTSEHYRRWLEQDVAYIIAPEERDVFHKLRTDEERDAFIEQFWTRRDTEPATAANEFKEEHYRRIKQFQEGLDQTLAGAIKDKERIRRFQEEQARRLEEVRQQLNEDGYRVTHDTFKEFQRLSSTTPATPGRLRQALTSSDPNQQAAAAVVAGELAPQSDVEARHALARMLIPVLASESDAVRVNARRALVRLADGEDCGPAPDAGEAEIAEARRRWKAWWDRVAAEQLAEKFAQRELALADQLAASGKGGKAQERYDRILGHWPDTEAAQSIRRRLQPQ